MSINVQNKKFLSLLRHLNIDIDQFPDKSFDGLFENMQKDMKYFLEWFMENINDDNVLTENETEIYNDMLKNNLFLTDDELNFALSKSSPKFDALESLNENYINKVLIDELNELNKELNQLSTVNENLKLHHNALKKNQINLKEESNKLKKEMELIQKKELQTLNMHLNSINMNLSSFNLNNYQNTINLNIFKDIINEEHDLVKIHYMNHTIQDIFSLSFCDKDLSEFSALKEKYISSGCFFIISKGFLEEIKYKILKAEEFLDLLTNEVVNHTSFDDFLNIWCHNDRLSTYDKLKDYVEMLEFDEFAANLTTEYDLELCNILNKKLQFVESWNIQQISKYESLVTFLRNDLIINLMLSNLINKIIENESKCFELLDGLHATLKQHQKKIKSITDTLELKTEKFHHFHHKLNEKKPLFALLNNENPNTVISEESQKDLFSSKRASDAVKFVFYDLNTFSESFSNELPDLENTIFCTLFIKGNCSKLKHLHLNLVMQNLSVTKREEKISCFMREILCGPTSQIQIVPSELLTKFYNSGRILINFPHELQKLLTEYVKFKDAISSCDRRKLLLWINFLNTKASRELEETHDKTIKDLPKHSLTKN